MIDLYYVGLCKNIQDGHKTTKSPAAPFSEHIPIIKQHKTVFNSKKS
jgi:hypothetical protein